MKPILHFSAAAPEKTDPYRALFVQNLCEEMAKDEKVILLCPRVHHGTPFREEKKNLKIYRFPYFSGGKRLKEYNKIPYLRSLSFFLSALWSLLSLSFSCRLIVAHWLLPMGPVAALVSWLRSLPLVVYIHGSDLFLYSQKNRLFFWLSQWALSQADLVLVTNGEMEKILKKNFSCQRVEVLPCGVEERFWEVRKKREKKLSPHFPARILFVGDMTKSKGAEILFEAAQILLSRRTDYHFTFLGEGPLRKIFLQKIEEEKREAFFSLPGAVPPAQVAQEMEKAHLFVLPSFSEGSPVAAREALSAGIPIIGSKISAFEELIQPGENGEILNSFDPAELSEILEKAIHYYQEREIPIPSSVQNLFQWKESLLENLNRL